MFYRIKKGSIFVCLCLIDSNMYKTLNWLILIIIIFVCSCEEKAEESINKFIVIGEANPNVLITPVDTVLYPNNRCHGLTYYIDPDLDKTPDFGFYIAYCYSPCTYSNTIKFYCLSKASKVVCNDTLVNPAILEKSDTIKESMKWVSDSMEMLQYQSWCNLDSGEYPTNIRYESGTWFNVKDKYIGLMIEKSNMISLGWLKISIEENAKVRLLEIGFQKAFNNMHLNPNNQKIMWLNSQCRTNYNEYSFSFY